LNISGDKLHDFRERFWHGDRLDCELVNFIRRLQSFCTTALLSNAWTGARKVLTKSKPCIDAFHISVFSCEIGLMKPDPEIYRRILKLCEVKPEEAIFVDDALENIEAANKLGIHAIQFKNAAQAIQDVTALLKAE
jgi:putative hydrolase of the HAD superfamily